MKFTPAGDVISDLEKKAADYENAARQTPEPAATSLRKLADLCRGWIATLKYGNWTS